MRFRKYILQPWVPAIVLAMVVFFGFFGSTFEKYRIRVVEEALFPINKDLTISFHDLDGDGIAEKIMSYHFKDAYHTIQVWKDDGGVAFQTNFDGQPLVKSETLALGDCDQDGFSEMYVFARENDSILLNCIEPYDTISPLHFTNFYLLSLTRKFAEPEFCIIGTRFTDLTGDGIPDMVFTFDSGMSKIPNRLCCFDIKQMKFITTPDFGSIISTLNFTDLDSDGLPEICGSMSAAANVPDSLGFPYSDYSAWFMVFDNNLEFLFDPVEFPGFRSSVQASPYVLNDKQVIVAYFHSIGPVQNIPELLIVDGKGRVIKRKTFPESPKVNHQMLVWGNKIIIAKASGEISVYNENFHITNEYHLDRTFDPETFRTFDLNNDRQPEFIFMTQKPMGILVTDYRFSHPVFLPIQNFNYLVFQPDIWIKGVKDMIVVNGVDRYYLLKYEKNPLYVLRFGILALLFGGFYVFIFIIRKLQLLQIEKKNRLRNQIAGLQLKSIKGQMDPHFTFNTFNTIAGLIQDESPSAYGPFLKFSRLVQNLIESSGSIIRPIHAEITFLENYLELEQIRFPGLFEYHIHLGNEVNPEMKIPKLLLQTYVENAIKHGIRPKGAHGKIDISFSHAGRDLEISITDNGIGREQAKSLNTAGSGIGLKVMEEYFALFNEFNDTKITVWITDLKDLENNAAGTEVKILIPLNFNFRMSIRGKQLPHSDHHR